MEWAYVLSGVTGLGILGIFGYLMYSDIRYQRLPNVCIVILTFLAIFFLILTELIIEQKSYSSVLIEHSLALLPITVFYFVIYLVSQGKLVGLGDVKLGVPIAILLPWQGALLTLVLANLLVFLVMVPFLVTKKIKLNTKIPFGPFLITACLLVFFGMKFFMHFF